MQEAAEPNARGVEREAEPVRRLERQHRTRAGDRHPQADPVDDHRDGAQFGVARQCRDDVGAVAEDGRQVQLAQQHDVEDAEVERERELDAVGQVARPAVHFEPVVAVGDRGGEAGAQLLRDQLRHERVAVTAVHLHGRLHQFDRAAQLVDGEPGLFGGGVPEVEVAEEHGADAAQLDHAVVVAAEQRVGVVGARDAQAQAHHVEARGGGDRQRRIVPGADHPGGDAGVVTDPLLLAEQQGDRHVAGELHRPLQPDAEPSGVFGELEFEALGELDAHPRQRGLQRAQAHHGRRREVVDDLQRAGLAAHDLGPVQDRAGARAAGPDGLVEQRLDLGHHVADHQRQQPGSGQLQATLRGQGEVRHGCQHHRHLIGGVVAERQDGQADPVADQAERHLGGEPVQRVTHLEPGLHRRLEGVQVAEPGRDDGDRARVEPGEGDQHLGVAVGGPAQFGPQHAAGEQVHLPAQPVGHPGDLVAGRQRNHARGGAAGEQALNVADDQRRVTHLGAQPVGVEHAAQPGGLGGSGEAGSGAVDAQGLADLQRDVEHRVGRVGPDRVGDLLQHLGHQGGDGAAEQFAEPRHGGQQLDLPDVVGGDHQSDAAGVDPERDRDGAPVAGQCQRERDVAGRGDGQVGGRGPGRAQVEPEPDHRGDVGGSLEPAGELHVQRVAAGRGEQEAGGQREPLGVV